LTPPPTHATTLNPPQIKVVRVKPGFTMSDTRALVW